MNDTGEIEGSGGVGRVEAFSDGVLAIIVTIMVLELKAPEEPGIEHLLRLWPTFVAYVLSYVYVAIYWVNHHRLFSHARRVDNALVWSNIALLFALSLVPFTTAYLGTHFLNPEATVLYSLSLLLPALAYYFLQKAVANNGAQGPAAKAYFLAMRRKGFACTLGYAFAAATAYFWPPIGVLIPTLIAAFWMKPWGEIDRFFLRCDLPKPA